MTPLSYEEIRELLYETMDQIEIAADMLMQEAVSLGCSVHDVRDERGGWPIHQILHDRVRAYAALAQLETLIAGRGT